MSCGTVLGLRDFVVVGNVLLSRLILLRRFYCSSRYYTCHSYPLLCLHTIVAIVVEFAVLEATEFPILAFCCGHKALRLLVSPHI